MPGSYKLAVLRFRLIQSKLQYPFDGLGIAVAVDKTVPAASYHGVDERSGFFKRDAVFFKQFGGLIATLNKPHQQMLAAHEAVVEARRGVLNVGHRRDRVIRIP